jgi:DNA polymerase III subunit tau-like protein
MDDSLNQLWQRVLAEVENRRPLFRAWLEPATPLSLDDEILTLGFPAEYSLAKKTLLKPAYRKFLEEVLSQLLDSSRAVHYELGAATVFRACKEWPCTAAILLQSGFFC